MKPFKNIRKWVIRYYDYLILALIYAGLHFFMHTDYWDDIATTSVLAEYHLDLFRYLSHIWQTWSSRIVIQGIWAVVGFFPNFVWKILDTVMILLLYHFSVKLTARFTFTKTFTHPYKTWLLLLFLSFPYALMGTAGWMTTTIVYTWTFAFLAYGFALLLKASSGKSIHPANYLFFGFAVLFAGNYNVTSVGMLFLFILAYILLPKTPPFKVLFWEATVLNVINILMFVLAPGNKSRMAADAIYHNTADLLNLSLFDKLRMGINSTFYHFISVPNAVLFLTCLILAVCAVYKTQSLTNRCIALIPVTLDVLWTVYSFFHYTLANQNLTYIYPDAFFQVGTKTEQMLAMFSAIVMICSIFYMIAFLTDFSSLSLGLCGSLLLLGLLPEIAVGFTTTVSVSIIRVASFLYITLIIINAVLVEYCNILRFRLWKNVLIFTALLGASFNILQVIRHILIYG